MHEYCKLMLSTRVTQEFYCELSDAMGQRSSRLHHLARVEIPHRVDFSLLAGVSAF